MIDLGLNLYRTIGREADRMGIDAYAVGGVVRDHFLQRPCTDIDIVCIGHSEGGEVHIGIELAHASSRALGGGHVSVFKTFGTASFRYTEDGREYELEFVGARRESYSHDSRKPVVENGTLEDDQRRRDFTVNALAVCLNADRYGELMDPFGGIKDMDDGILRTPLDPDITFSDDPLRMMRAVRFATQLNFDIYPETFEAIKRNAYRLEIISSERIVEELNKILACLRPSRGLKMLEESKLLDKFLPELIALQGVEFINGKGHKDNFLHTMEVVDNVAMASETPNVWLEWAALLHDIAKPVTKRFDPVVGWTFHGHDAVGVKMVARIFRRLHMPNNEKMKYVQKLVGLHLRPIALVEDTITDSAVRRLLFEAGDDIDDLMMLCHADVTSKNSAKITRCFQNFAKVREKMREIEEKDKLRNWRPPFDGQDIMRTFDMRPCKDIGIIKDAVCDAILDGEIENSRPAALQRMIEEGEKLGYQTVNKPEELL